MRQKKCHAADEDVAAAEDDNDVAVTNEYHLWDSNWYNEKNLTLEKSITKSSNPL